MRMPKKLITTMGIELTFVPSIYDLINEAVPGAINTPTSYGGSDLRVAHASFMSNVLKKRGVKVYNCGTDPGCVEVPTMPYDDGKELLTACRNVHSAAEVCMLQPYATYTRGGGAHIHTGRVGKDDAEKRRMTAHVMAWMTANPWFAWAHAIPKDEDNANPLTAQDVYKKLDARMEYDMAIARLQQALKDLQDFQKDLSSAEKELHTVKGWEQSHQGMDEYTDMEYWRRNVVRCHRYVAEYLKAFYEASATYAASLRETARVMVTDIRPYNCKNRVTVDRGQTIEFRCFTMPWDYKGHVKQFVLVNNLLKLLYKNASGKDGEYVDYPMMGAQQINSMKYSEAKRGFNAMLESLALDPDDYRAERVNIAVRFRQLRTERKELLASNATRAI
jgi:hypothetical protein